MKSFLLVFFLMLGYINPIRGVHLDFIDEKDSNLKIISPPLIYLPYDVWDYITQMLDGSTARTFSVVSKFSKNFVAKRKFIKFKIGVPSDIFSEYVKIQKPTYLDISNCQNILPEDFYNAVSFCDKINYLNISNCYEFKSFPIFTLSHNWQNLEIIKMDYCHNITPGDFREYLESFSLPQKTIALFRYAFKARKLNLRRGTSNLSMLLGD